MILSFNSKYTESILLGTSYKLNKKSTYKKTKFTQEFQTTRINKSFESIIEYKLIFKIFFFHLNYYVFLFTEHIQLYIVAVQLLHIQNFFPNY